MLGREESLTADQVSAEAIDDSEWVEVDAVERPELSFEVGGPDLVGLGHWGRGSARMAKASVPSFSGDEIVAFEDVAYGASSGSRPGRLSFLEQREELLCSPRWVPLPRFEDGVEGWRATVVWQKERGIDIEAFKEGQRWIIEAKGRGSRDQMCVNYFMAILGETLQRMNDPQAKYSIALPDHRQFRNLWTRLPEVAKLRTGITILFAGGDGNVQAIGSTT